MLIVIIVAYALSPIDLIPDFIPIEGYLDSVENHSRGGLAGLQEATKKQSFTTEKSMKCPKCKTVKLQPTRLEEDLPVMGCPSCDGILVSLLYYRDWAERSTLPMDVETVELAIAEENDTKAAMTCPKCARLMTKYQITGGQANRLDVCSSCDEAWIDSGEWTLLKSLELAKDLPRIFTDSWQKKIRKQTTEKQRYERLESIVGPEDAQRAREFREWLDGKSNKSTIVHYIGYE